MEKGAYIQYDAHNIQSIYILYIRRMRVRSLPRKAKKTKICVRRFKFTALLL